MKKTKLPSEGSDFFDSKLKDKCHAIYEKVKEAWTPDKRSFEQAEKNPEFDKAYLDDCIEKATPNLSKIKDVDKELAEIRGESQITDADIEAWAKELFHNLQFESPIIMAGYKGLIIGAKAVLNGEIKHIEK